MYWTVQAAQAQNVLLSVQRGPNTPPDTQNGIGVKSQFLTSKI
jgi:hypothetical protein